MRVKANSENGHLVFSILKKKQENNGVGDISSLLTHCQTNRLYYKQAVLYISMNFSMKCYKNRDNCLLALSPQFNSGILRFMRSASRGCSYEPG